SPAWRRSGSHRFGIRRDILSGRGLCLNPISTKLLAATRLSRNPFGSKRFNYPRFFVSSVALC
ncbi:MAG TPA: hypothetical protein VEG31_04910, partial [Thermoproteota archaeon]|nr:hypothetical protein [Thermoproteota archaeon]